MNSKDNLINQLVETIEKKEKTPLEIVNQFALENNFSINLAYKYYREAREIHRLKND